MNKMLKVFTILAALLFLMMGVRILVAPEGALSELGMPMLDGLGLSTQIGDLGAFFVTTCVLMVIGVITGKREWLYAPAILLGLTAIFRIWASVGHGAAFASEQIVIEVVVTGVLLATALTTKPSS